PPPAPRMSPVQQLQHDIAAVLAAPALQHSVWGVLARSLGNDETLFSSNADTLLMPASNMKIVTLAVAADRLGWSYQYETRLVAGGQIRDGILTGDVIAVGSGGPSIGGPDNPGTRLFDEWAEQLNARGLRRIEGGVLGDDRAFDDETLGNGWTWDDLGEGYSARIGALQFNENSVRATI